VPNRELVIDPAFEGPPEAAHGGYTCGLLSPYLPADAAITLRKPVPLGVALRLEPRDGEGFPGRTTHSFPRCVVCGTGRADADAFRIFPGPLPGRDLLAAVWHPTGSAVAGGSIRPDSPSGVLQAFSRQTWITVPRAGAPR
jgi:hypothetical protein